MGCNRKLWLLLLLPALLFGRSGSSKYYFYPEIRTEVHLNADGSAHIIQQRTYEFHGSFSWAFVDLKKKGSAGIVFNRLSEQTPQGWQPIQPQEVTDQPASLYIRWGYSAQNETRTFQLDYTVKGAVTRYADVADFEWKVIEDEHERVSQAHTEISLPGPSPSLFKVYIHAEAPAGKLAFNDAMNQAVIDQRGIPSNFFVEVRVLSDPTLYPGVAQQPGNRYQRILADEKSNFTRSTLRKYVLLPLGLLMIAVLPLFLLLVFYFRFGREPKIAYEATYEHEPPRMAPPLAVPAIMHQKPDKSMMSQEMFRAMFATLLDLARQGIVSVQEMDEGHGKRFAFKLDQPDKVATLEQFSRTTAQFFFEKIAGPDGEVTPEAIRSYSQFHSNSIIAMLSRLLDNAVAWWRVTLGVEFTEAASRRAYSIYIASYVADALVGVISLANGLMAFLGRGHPGAWVISVALAVVFGLLYIRLGRSILRWTESALLEHKRWQAFRKFLHDFSAIKDAPVSLLAIWEQYYVYATALGVAREFLKNVTRLAKERGAGLALPAWYVMSAGSRGGGVSSMAEGLASFESFASNFSSMMNSFSASTPSGGGFAGGGGGGGGGGSSGAG